MTVQVQPVAVAGAEGNVVVVAAGLSPGQTVVTAGVHTLTPGQKVTLFEATRAVPAAGRRRRQPLSAGARAWTASARTRGTAAPEPGRGRQLALQHLALGAGAPGADALPDGRAAGAGRGGLLPARAGRGSAVHLPRHGRAGLLARRQRAADGRAGHRQDREDAAGGAVRRQDPLLHQARRVGDHPAAGGLVARQGRAQQLVPGAQARRRHAPHAAGGRDRAGLQRRLRRRLRLHLRALGRRLHARGTARLRRPRAPAVAEGARRGQGRDLRRAGREDLHRDLAEAAGPAGAGHEPGHRAARRAERGRRRRRAQRRQREPAGARRRAVQLGGRAAGASRSAPSTRPPARPARCAWTTWPR